MSFSTVTWPSGRERAGPTLLQGLAIAASAATLGYLVHHLPPLQDHPAAGVVAVLVAVLTVALPASVMRSRQASAQLPVVVVASEQARAVRALTRADLDFCAMLHADSLDHGFFVRLGHRFLRAYYATFLDSPHAVALVATAAGQPVGALVGATSARAHARWVLRHRGAALAFAGCLGLIAHPGTAVRFARTRVGLYARVWRRHRRGSHETADAGMAGRAVLSHLAVVAGARRIGAGRELAKVFESAALDAGAVEATLTTLEGPASAGPFYARLGWTRYGVRTTPDGGSIEEWIRRLGPE